MKNRAVKILIFFSFIITLGISANSASAYYYSYPNYYQSNLPSYQASYPINYQNSYMQPVVVNTPVIYTQTVTPVVHVNQPIVTTTLTPATQTTNTDSQGTTTPINTTIQATTGNDLTALSLNGSGGFMPSSIWQWILVVVLILVIVIMARILSKKPQELNAHVAQAHY